MLIKKVKLCNKDTTAFASDDLLSLTLLCGWCRTFLANNADKLQCKCKITWKPCDLLLSRAQWWSHLYKAEHLKIKSRGQWEEEGWIALSNTAACSIFWPLAVHYLQLLGWMDFFFLFGIILRSSTKTSHQTGVCLLGFSLEKIRVIRKQKEYIWPAI